MYTCICTCNFAIHLKLTQYCKSTTHQFKKYIKKKKSIVSCLKGRDLRVSGADEFWNGTSTSRDDFMLPVCLL